MWELVKRSLQRERAITTSQLGRSRRASVQRVHNEIVEAFLKAGRQRVRRAATSRLGSVDSVAGEGVRGRGVRRGIWRAVSSLGFAIAMAIRLLNPYVLISVAFSQHRSLLAHLTARVDSMRAVLSPRIGRRRRLTAWVQDILPQRHVPEAATAVWQDGSLLCGIVETAVPGSCPGYDSLSPPNADRGATLWLGQKLAARYLGVPPAFSDDEFSQAYLTVYMERRMLRYLLALKAASARVEAERQRRLTALQSSGGSPVEDDAFSLDTIAHSSLPPGESLLECVARGMGLILGVQGRKSSFYLYLNPHHPHRHVHRLMQKSNTLDRHPSFEEEAGTILMQIRGPEGDFGAALLSTSPGSSSSVAGPSLDIFKEHWYGRIPISYETSEESVLVSFVPQSFGRHELILLQRGGSHVPGSPFSITVEESSEVPDDNGRRRRFGSEPVDGLAVPTPKGMTKASSYESGLDKGHRRIGSGGSDPGSRSDGDTPDGIRKKRRIVARVVDFVTEKMLLTEDGKLERLPKKRRGGPGKASKEERSLPSADNEVREIMQNRHYSTLYTSWGRMKHFEIDDPIYGTYPGRWSPVESGKSEATYGFSGLEKGINISEHSSGGHREKGESRIGEKMIRVSDIASHNEKESLDSINFRDHCRRILWLCDILLKHSPRQESLEMLNTAGDILEGKRVHPTILEETEPEDAAPVPLFESTNEPPSVQPNAFAARARTTPQNSHALAQRLQRQLSDTGGLNEVSSWKDGRRQLHSWSRKERDGGGGSGTVGGRLIHKGGSYRGVVVRDMTPEVLSGAYAGGEDLMDDEGSLQSRELDDDSRLAEEKYLLEDGRPPPKFPHHSLPKRRPPSLAKQLENRGHSEEMLEQRTSTSDREKDGSGATVSGKEFNKSNASNNKRHINYSDRDLKQNGGKKWNPEKRIEGMASGGVEVLKDHPRHRSKKEDKWPRGIEGQHFILAAAIALAEGGGGAKREEEGSWEETLSNIPRKERDTGEEIKNLLVASSKGEPPPVQELKGGLGRVVEGREDAACAEGMGGEDEEGKGETKRESAAPASAEAEAPGAGEINERLPPPPSDQRAQPPTPPSHDPSKEQSPESPERIVSKSSDVEGSGTSSASGYPRTISEKGWDGEEREPIKEEVEGIEKRAEDTEEEVDDEESVKVEAVNFEKGKEAGETRTVLTEADASKGNEKCQKDNAKIEEEDDRRKGSNENQSVTIFKKEQLCAEDDLVEKVAEMAESSEEYAKTADVRINEDKYTNIGDHVVFEAIGKNEEKREELNAPEMGEEERIVEGKDEEILKISDKQDCRQDISGVNDKIEGNDTIKEEEGGQRPEDADKDNVKEEGLSMNEEKNENKEDNIKETNSGIFAEAIVEEEMEEIKQENLINKDYQALVVRKEVDSLNEMVAGKEEEPIESNTVRGKGQLGGIEESCDPQNSTMAREQKAREVNNKAILDGEKVSKREKLDNFTTEEEKQGEYTKDLEGEREKRDGLKDHEVCKVIGAESGEIVEEVTRTEGKVNISGEVSKNTFIEKELTSKVEKTSNIGEVIITERKDSDGSSKSKEIRDIKEEKEVRSGEEDTKVKLDEREKDKPLSRKPEGGWQVAMEDVSYVITKGEAMQDGLEIELRCGETCGTSAIEEGIQISQQSENKAVPIEESHEVSNERKSVEPELRSEVAKEGYSIRTCETLQAHETQNKENWKRMEEIVSEEESSIEIGGNKENIGKDEMVREVETAFVEREIADEKINIANLENVKLDEDVHEGINEEPMAKSASDVPQESKNLEPHCISGSSEVEEINKYENAFKDLTQKEGYSGSVTESLLNNLGRITSVGIVTRKGMEEEFSDESVPKKVASEENITVRENKYGEKILSVWEKVEEKTKESEDSLTVEDMKKINEVKKILNKNEYEGELSDGFVEYVKMSPEKETTVKDENVEKEGESITNEDREMEEETCLKSEKEGDGNEHEEKVRLATRKETRDDIGKTPNRGMEKEEYEIDKPNENTLIEFKKEKLIENACDIVISMLESTQGKKNGEIMKSHGENVLEEEIRESDSKENSKINEEINFPGKDTERIDLGELSHRKEENENRHDTSVEEKYKNVTECNISRKDELQENDPFGAMPKDKPNIEGAEPEEIVCEHSEQKKTKNIEQCYNHDQKENIDEVPTKEEIKEEISVDVTAKRGELTSEDLESERTESQKGAQHEDKCTDKRRSFKDEEESKRPREAKKLEETPPSDKVSTPEEVDIDASRNTAVIRENSMGGKENVLAVKANAEDMKEVVRAESQEGLKEEGRNETETYEEEGLEIISTEGEISEKTDEVGSLPERGKVNNGTDTERIPSIGERKESEKGSAEIVHEIAVPKEEETLVKTTASDLKAQALHLTEAEGGEKEVVEGGSRGHCEAERTEAKSEQGEGKPESGMSETDKNSTDGPELARRRGEAETPLGEEAGSLTYREIIGRIIYTDSFPSDSLEWFEEGGRKGDAEGVEGTMERIEGDAGGPEVAAGMAVGDEVWKEPEISREEPFREGVDSVGPEATNKGGGVIGEEEEEGKVEEEEEEDEVDEEEGRDPWSTGLQSNVDDIEDERGGFDRKCLEGGHSLRMGVGVVVAGGIISRDASRKESSEGGGASGRRSSWRASRSRSIEEGLPLPKEDPAGRQWEEICMGIDAMEDRSISEVIEEVSGKRRKRRTRKERAERSGKAIRVEEKGREREGENRPTQETVGKGVPVAESPIESLKLEDAKEMNAMRDEQRTPSSDPTKVEGKEEEGMCEASADRGEAGVLVEEGENEGQKGERTGAYRDGSRRLGMLGEQWWLSSSSSRSSSMGGVKIEEVRVDWIGSMEEGKRGRGPAEEEGVEAKEHIPETEYKAEEGAGGKGRRDRKDEAKISFVGEGKEDSLKKKAASEGPRIKVVGARHLETSSSIPITKFQSVSERIEEQQNKYENVKTVEVEGRKDDVVSKTSPKCMDSENFQSTTEKEERANRVQEEDLESDVDKEKEGEEQAEDDGADGEDENEKDPVCLVSSYGEEKGFKDVKGEVEDTQLENVFVVGESDKSQRDNEVKGSKSTQSAGDEIFLDLANKYSPTEVENSFGRGPANRGKLSQAESSGEWEFVDTGRHFAENENEEEIILGECEREYPCNKQASSEKGLFLASFLGCTDNAHSPGAVVKGIEKVNDLLKSFVDISKSDERVPTSGTSPKREGEELCGVRMTLDEWEGKKRQDNLNPETEVIVGECDFLGDWERVRSTIDIFEVASGEIKATNPKDGEEVGGKTKEIECKRPVDSNEGNKQSVAGQTENERKSSSAEEEARSDESQSYINDKSEEVESSTTQDDDDIEEIIRTEPDEWSTGFPFMGADHRSTFRNLEDLLGGELSFRMTACSSQFNLWPSQEAFGGKGTWMEHIDMDAFMNTAQSGQQSRNSTGLLKNMTTFAKTCIVRDQEGSSATSEQCIFSRDGEKTEGRKNVNWDEEEEIVLEEQDFDDINDESGGHLEPGSHWGPTYHSYDFGSNSKVKKGDAFIIFETPGQTTYPSQENEMSSDEDMDDKSGTRRNVGKATLIDDDLMGGLELEGDWEEGIIFLDDDDDKDVQKEGRRGSGEYKNFADEVVGKEVNELWSTITQANEGASSGDAAFAIIMDEEDRNEKTPVLPTGRWCPRLPILSPAMSAISEEESEEILPEKEDKQKEESATFTAEKEDGGNITSGTRVMKNSESRNTGLPDPIYGDEIPEGHMKDFSEESGCLKVTLHQDDDFLKAEILEEGDSKYELPKMDVEVEDGFGESFSKRRSSTSSVVSDSGTPEPVADCGAAFVVSSELAVTLALGVSITQIIPPVIDLPEIPPLPQVEEATDALCIGKADEVNVHDHYQQEDLKSEGEKNSGPILETEGTSYSNSIVHVDEKSHTWRETIKTQTEPTLLLEGVKEIEVHSVKTEEDLLRMETSIGEKLKREMKGLQSKVSDQRTNVGASKPVTQKENIEAKSFSVKEKSNLAPEVESTKKQDKYFEANKNHAEIALLGQGEVNKERSKREGADFEDKKKKQFDDILINTSGAIKKTPGATAEGIKEREVSESKNYRDLIAFEQAVGEKGEKTSFIPEADIGEAIIRAGTERRKIPFQERESDWYTDEGEGIECWNLKSGVATAIVESEDVEYKKLREEKGIVFEGKRKVPEKEMSVFPVGEMGRENNLPGEDPKKSSPPGGVRKKESLEEKTKDSPPRPIPLEKLLGWPSENGNGNGSGRPGIGPRRESVFDDYNFSEWDNGFQLSRDANNLRSKSQDSTGLEYYLDVDQLLNVPLAATEPEVKYVSAKEIMDTFSRGEGMDSPEKVFEKEVEFKREQLFKSDSSDEGAAGGISIEILDGGVMEKAAGFSNRKGGDAVRTGQGADLWEGDIFSEYSQNNVPSQPKKKLVHMPQIFTNQEVDSSVSLLDEDRKDNTVTSTMKEGIKTKEKRGEVEDTENLILGFKIPETEKDLSMDFGSEGKKSFKISESKHVGDMRTDNEKSELSNKETVYEKETQRETQTSGRKVRNIIDIFERPESTQIKKEVSPMKKEKVEKYSLTIYPERTQTEEIKSLPSVEVVSEVGSNQSAIRVGEAMDLKETIDNMSESKVKGSLVTLPPLVTDTGIFGRKNEVESIGENYDLEHKTASEEKARESKSKESGIIEPKEIFNERATKLDDVSPITIDDKREAILSLTEEPVVGWEAIKVATEVEKIILSTGNGTEQKKIMGGIVIGPEPDKIFEAIEQRAKDISSESKVRKEVRNLSAAKVGLIDLQTKTNEPAARGSGVRREVKEEARKSRLGRLPTSSSFEEYGTVVSEAYQFLDSLRDTIDEDEDRQTEEGAKEPGGRVEGPVCGTGSEVEEFHPCEELPDGRREAVPCAVEGAPMGGLAGEQSSPSSPERCKTAESSSSSSPYSSLPTFADVSSGILSSASSKDENFSKMEEGTSRNERPEYKSEFRDDLVAEAGRAAEGGSGLQGDYLDEEIDSSALAKMNVASRKEYWDRRLQRVQEKKKEVVTAVPKKPLPLRVSGIVARGRMSFEKSRSRDDYTTSDSGGDGGKSSSESSPSSRGKSFSYRPKAVYSKGTKSALPSYLHLKTDVRDQEAKKCVLLEEEKVLKSLEELSNGTTEKVCEPQVEKEIPADATDTKEPEQPVKELEDKEDLSQIPVIKRKEIWDQKIQKMSEDESPPSSLEHRIIGKRKSSRVESTKKLLRNLSTEGNAEEKVPLARTEGMVPITKQNLREQSMSIDSSSLDEKLENDEVIQKSHPVKTTGSVSRLAKLFSSPTPEPPPTKYKGRPIPKGKPSKGLDKGNLKPKGESTEETKSEIPTPILPQRKMEISHSTADVSGTDARNQNQVDNTLGKGKGILEGKDDKIIEHDRRISNNASAKNKPPQDTANISSLPNNKVTAEKDTLAKRRKKYLDSVQQSIEGEEIRKENVKKSESEDSMKERIERKAITDVRNIWEKRASLESSESISESTKMAERAAIKLTATGTERKKTEQDEKPTSKRRVGSSDKAIELQIQRDAQIQGIENSRKVDPSLVKKGLQEDEAITRGASCTPSEVERSKENILPGKVISHQSKYLEGEPENETLLPLVDKPKGENGTDMPSSDSHRLREGKLLSGGEPSQKTLQSTKENAQQPNRTKRESERRRTTTSSDKVKGAEQNLQAENKPSRMEKSLAERPAPRERIAPPAQIITPNGKDLPPDREGPLPKERKETSEAAAPSSFKGRRHSSGCVNPPEKMDVSKMRERWGSLEEKILESTGSKGKRDSVEIRVTDDEDICVMREVVTSVPRFLPKEKMETHEEEDGRDADVVESYVVAEEARLTIPSPYALEAKKKSLPQRTLSIQVPGIVASSRRRFESGKTPAEDMPTLSEEVVEDATMSPPPRNPPSARRGPEERRMVGAEGFEECQKENKGRESEKGRRLPMSKDRRATERETVREEGTRLRAPEASGRELFRAVPISVTVEEEDLDSDIRVEIIDLDETTPGSKGEEGGDDGRSAASRRAPKGKAQKQPPPSTASSPDTESEGAAETKLLSFLSTPASQIRRHSAVDVATLRSFTAAASEGPRLRRRGSGDLGSPARKKEDESKKRFTRARQFFETLEKGKDSPPQSGSEDSPTAKSPAGSQSMSKKKKKKPKEEEGAERASLGKRAGGVAKHRPQVRRTSKDSSESTTESEMEKKHRRKSRRSTSEATHSAPGSDVDSSGSAPHNHPSLHRRKRDREFVLRSQMFGGSEREVKVSERFNVMDLFRDVAGPGTGVSSGRATPLGIPHQAAVLAALRSVEDVRSSATTSPYDMYRPVEAANDCEPTAVEVAGGDEGEPAASANDENANVEEDGNVTFSSPMTLRVKKEYQAEYPHLPMTSPRHSRHRSSNTDLIPRNVLLQLDTNQNPPKKSSSSRRSIAELF